MFRSLIPALSFFLIAVGCFTGVLFAEPSLQVRKLRVTFPSENEVRVEGEMRCNQLMPDGMNSPDTNIEVNVDFPRGKDGFARLPEYFKGYYTGVQHKSDPVYSFEGEEHRIAYTKPPFYNSTHLRWTPVLDTTLNNFKDDGRWIGFDKTLRFKGIQKGSKLRYRVVLGWKHSYLVGKLGYRFAANFCWVVYGPFTWGQAPGCDKLLTAKSCQTVSFTERGVELKAATKLPDRTDEDQHDGQDSGAVKREKLVRKSDRPSQLEAVNASNELERKLAAMTGVQHAGVRATPRSATIEISLGDDLKGVAITKLLMDSAVESAYALPWIGSMEITAAGGAGRSVVTINWGDVSSYVANDLSAAEFFETWSVQGAALVAPR